MKCSRCIERGLECDNAIPTGRNVAPEHSESNSTRGAVFHDAPDSEAQEHAASPAPDMAIEFPGISEGANSTDIFQGNMDMVFAPSSNNNCEFDFDFGQFESFEFDNEGVGASWDFGAISIPFNISSDIMQAGSSPSIPRSTHLRGPASFDLRAKTSQAPIAALLMRTLRSYAFKILQKESFPPFLSPTLYSWAETEEGPSQQVSYP